MAGEPAERPSTVGVFRQGYAGVSAGPELWRAAGEGGVESYDLKGGLSSEVSARLNPSKHNHKSRRFC